MARPAGTLRCCTAVCCQGMCTFPSAHAAAPTPHARPRAPRTPPPPPAAQKEGEGQCATALREVMLLKALSHPNIMSLEAIHMQPAELSLCLAFPYAETGGPGGRGRGREGAWAGRRGRAAL